MFSKRLGIHSPAAQSADEELKLPVLSPSWWTEVDRAGGGRCGAC